jgi:hypothetical protein
MPGIQTLGAAFNVISATNKSAIYEVNGDGSIRQQNWKEKLGNLGSRLIGTYAQRKESKDAAVANALLKLAQSVNTLSSHYDQVLVESGGGASLQKFEHLQRFHEAKAKVEARNAPRAATVIADGNTQIRRDSVASLNSQGAIYHGATTSSSRATSAGAATAVKNGPSKAEYAEAKENFLWALDKQIELLRDRNSDYGEIDGIASQLAGDGELDFEKLNDEFKKKGLDFNHPDLARLHSAQNDLVAWNRENKDNLNSFR